MTTKAMRFFMPVWDTKIATVLTRHGHKVTGLKQEPHDVLCFVDGAPVCPFLYGQRTISGLGVDLFRDQKEWALLRGLTNTLPKVGFGRGAHLLNAFSGGFSFQDCDNHDGPTVHKVTNLVSGACLWSTTSHRQVMQPSESADILVVADNGCTYFTTDAGVTKKKDMVVPPIDVEACYYPHTNSLCFQSSDLTHAPTASMFFELLANAEMLA